MSGIFHNQNNKPSMAAVDSKNRQLISQESEIIEGTFSKVSLGNGETFTGAIVDLLPYNAVSVSLIGTVAGATGTLKMQFCPDINFEVSNTRSIEFSIIDLTNEPPHVRAPIEKYYRTIYVNDATPQTTFEINTYFHKNLGISIYSSVAESLNRNTDVLNTKTIIFGKTPNQLVDTYRNVEIDHEGKLKIAVEKTAFGSLLVSEEHPIVQHTFEYTVDNTDLTKNTKINGGTVTQADGMAVIQSNTTIGGDARIESFRHVRYHSGEGLSAKFTSLFTIGTDTSHRQYIGLIADDLENGYGIGYKGVDFGILRISNNVEIWVTQNNFNVDKLDGTGRSGITIDTIKGNVFKIEIQYLGFGDIYYSLEDPETGDFMVFHKIKYANANIVPSVLNPNFHLLARVFNGTSSDNLTLKIGSMSAFVQGKAQLIQIHRPLNAFEAENPTVGATLEQIFSIRCKSTYASKNNFIDILIENISIATDGTKIAKIKIFKNASITGSASWVDVSTNNSVVETDIARQAGTVSGGKLILAFSLAKIDSVLEGLHDFELLLQNGETLDIVAQSAGSSDIDVSIVWKELF